MEMVISPGTPSLEGEGHRVSRGGGGEAAPCTADLADLVLRGHLLHILFAHIWKVVDNGSSCQLWIL